MNLFCASARSLCVAAGFLAAMSASLAQPLEHSTAGIDSERHPALNSAGTRALTASGAPGDPLNIAFIGTEDELQTLMAGAQWVPADPITFRSSLRITVDSLARRPYTGAPVSSLFINRKKQDLAFEQPAANNPSRRHHVRFWRLGPLDALNRPLWVGAATYDSRIGFSHTNGHVTHHIAAAVDDERDKLIQDAQSTGRVTVAWIDNFQPVLQGRNGGGDPFHTDGRLAVLVIPMPALAR